MQRAGTPAYRRALAGPVACDVTPSNTCASDNRQKDPTMLYTIAVILVILWALGLVSSYTMGGVIHVLLVIALVMIVANFISGRKSL